jgi:hypothetical protein
MSKIKDIQDKMTEIQTRLTKDVGEYHEFRFRIVQRIFIITVACYFVAYLFTIGGFYFSIFSLGVWSALTFHLYSLVIIATVWFAFGFAEHFVAIYIPTQKWIPYVVLVLFALLGGLSLFFHIFSPSL